MNIGRIAAEAEAPILWPPDTKSWLIGKDPDAGKDWRREEKGMAEDEMAEWHHRLDGRECEWAPGLGDGQGGLACCDSRGRKGLDTTERLNWTELKSSPESLLLAGSTVSLFCQLCPRRDRWRLVGRWELLWLIEWELPLPQPGPQQMNWRQGEKTSISFLIAFLLTAFNPNVIQHHA